MVSFLLGTSSHDVINSQSLYPSKCMEPSQTQCPLWTPCFIINRLRWHAPGPPRNMSSLWPNVPAAPNLSWPPQLNRSQHATGYTYRSFCGTCTILFVVHVPLFCGTRLQVPLFCGTRTVLFVVYTRTVLFVCGTCTVILWYT